MVSEQNRQDEIQDTQSSVGNFSGVVVQTPQASVVHKEMPNTQGSIAVEEESKTYSTNKPPNGGGLLSGIEQQRQKL